MMYNCIHLPHSSDIDVNYGINYYGVAIKDSHVNSYSGNIGGSYSSNEWVSKSRILGKNHSRSYNQHRSINGKNNR